MSTVPLVLLDHPEKDTAENSTRFSQVSRQLPRQTMSLTQGPELAVGHSDLNLSVSDSKSYDLSTMWQLTQP